MVVMLTVAVVTVALFLLSVLFFPSIGKNKKFKIYSWIPLIGALFMIALGDLGFKDVFRAFTENTSVNPIKILILFLSMTVYSLILDKTGFFRYISGVVLKKSGHNQYVIFLSLYAVIAVLTVFTSNDIVILTFTPFICNFCRAAKIDVIPYLIMEFVVANTWSLFLLIGNPTNIYISGAFNISFTEYFINMALPTVAAGLVSLGLMLLIFGKKLRTPVDTHTEIEKVNDRPLMTVSLAHLLMCIVLLAVSQYTGMEMWLISLMMGVSDIVCSLAVLVFRHKSIAPVGLALKGMPFEIIPFVIGMFIIVMGYLFEKFAKKSSRKFAGLKIIITFAVY
jgi:arsenical pump membrane protein